MNLFELFVKIGADTSQAEKGMKNTQKNSETLTNKIKVMSAQFEEAQKSVDKLTEEFNESVRKAGATDKATQELAKKLANAEKEAGKFAKELDEVQKEAEQSKDALDDCNEEIKDTGEKAEKSGKGLSNFASKLGSGLATAVKIGAAAVGAAATGIAALTTAAVNNYAEYEQLVGGVETLFSKSAKTVQAYAENAYKTAGLSANAYMETVTGFSASMIHSTSQVLDEEVNKQYYTLAREHQRLSQYTDKESKAAVKAIEKEMEALEGRLYKTVKTEESIAKAAEMSNMAVTDMADNANKMGTNMEMIQNAYAGFAKQNYTIKFIYSPAA